MAVTAKIKLAKSRFSAQESSENKFEDSRGVGRSDHAKIIVRQMRNEKFWAILQLARAKFERSQMKSLTVNEQQRFAKGRGWGVNTH